MANWKKIIVSGSDAELNHITASGTISASGKLFGNLPINDTLTYVIVYNTATGRLERKELNLISTQEAAGLYLLDSVEDGFFTQNFRFSYDTGSSAVGGTVYSYQRLSASLDGGSTYGHLPTSNIDWVGINGELTEKEPTNTAYYVAGGITTNNTSSIQDSRHRLRPGTSKIGFFDLYFQAIDNTTTATPAYNSSETYLNYLAKSFSKSTSGSIEVYLNDNATPVLTANLENGGAAISTTQNNVTLDLSAARNNLDGSTGDVDISKNARSGSILLNANAQLDGYNFIYAIHTGSHDGTQFTRITTFNEWFYDIAGAGTAMTEGTTGVISNPTFDATATESISGIRFYDATAADNTELIYGTQANNQYRNVFPVNNGINIDGISTTVIDLIEVTQSGQYQDTTHARALQSVVSPTSDEDFDLCFLQNTANAYTSDTEVTASFGITFGNITNDFYQPSTFLDAFTTDDIESADNVIGFQFHFEHITGHKATLDITAHSEGSYMVNTLTANANDYQFEDFKKEQYRIQSESIEYGDDPTGATYTWDGKENIDTGTVGHKSGSVVYYSHMLYPTKVGDAGDFTTTLGPLNNQPDYTSITGEREYIRYFKVNAANQGNKSMQLELVGAGKIVSSSDTTYFTNGGDGIKVFFQRLGPNSTTLTNSAFSGSGWVDVINPSVREGTSLQEGVNHYIPIATSTSNISYSPNTTVGSSPNDITVETGVLPFNDPNANLGVETNEYLALRILIPQGWTGNLEAIALRYGAKLGATKLLGSTYTNL